MVGKPSIPLKTFVFLQNVLYFLRKTKKKQNKTKQTLDRTKKSKKIKIWETDSDGWLA